MSEWIRVEDELPKEDCHCLCYFHFNIISVMWFYKSKKLFKSEHHDEGFSWSQSVTHWMPLPEHPK